MLMMTRTSSLLEFGDGDRRQLALDVAQILSASLCTERAPGGATRQVLCVCLADGAPCLRIENGPYELAALHQAITEMMSETDGARRVH